MIAALSLFKDKTPTPTQRFSNKESIASFLSSSYGIGVDPSDVLSQSLYPTSLRGGQGTTILNTYVDIRISKQEIKEYLDAYSYVFCINSDYGVFSEYLFFVDRVERSMVDAETLQARFYLTLDVWDTYILHHSRVPTVEGEVLRAHVNDIVNGHPTTEFTTYERECDVYDTQYKTGNVTPNTPVSIAYLHIAMLSKEGAGFDRYDYFQGDLSQTQSFTSSLYHLVVPFNVATFNTIPFGEPAAKFNDNISLSFIDNVSIVSMFITVDTPYYLAGKYNANLKMFVVSGDDVTRVIIGESNFLYGLAPKSGETRSQPLGNYSFDNVFRTAGAPFPLKTTSDYYPTLPTNPNTHAPINYEDYIKDYQFKFYSAVYNPVTFNISSETITLDAMQQNPELVRPPITWQYDYDTGDLIVWQTNNKVLNRFTSVDRLTPDNSVTPYRQSNEVINVSLFKALTGGFAQTISSVANKDLLGVTQGAMNIGASIAEADIARRTPKTTKGTGYLNSMLLTAIPYIAYYRYLDNNMSVRRDLYLYGYTTNLCIDDIIRYHKRRYFNYIKASDLGNVVCTESLPSFLLDDIKTMFINGVYLWNVFEGGSTFSYSVVNYPLSSGWREQTKEVTNES